MFDVRNINTSVLVKYQAHFSDTETGLRIFKYLKQGGGGWGPICEIAAVKNSLFHNCISTCLFSTLHNNPRIE